MSQSSRQTTFTARQREMLRKRAQAASQMLANPSLIAPRRDAATAPLSFAQLRLWFLDQLVPNNPFYNIPIAFPIHGVIQPEMLKRALNEIIRRHEVLRTTFAFANGEPAQVIGKPFDIPMQMKDLRGMPPAQRDTEVHALATAEACCQFNLSQGPLLRSLLIQTDAQAWIFCLTMHHIVSDGWSMGILYSELNALYAAYCRGESSPLPELAIQYADFATWQRQHLTGPVLDRHLNYWRKQLQDLPELRLPSDRPRSQRSEFRGSVIPVEIASELVAATRRLGERHGCTLFMTLLAAFKTLLWRYTGQTDLCVGAPIANRTNVEVESLIGFFVNNLVLRTQLSPELTFAAVMQRVRETAINAYAHQDLPFERIVEELQPERDFGRNPLCQVTLQIQNSPTAARTESAVEIRGLLVDRQTSIFDMAISFWETQDSLVGGIEFSTELFDRATVERFYECFLTLLHNACLNSDQPIHKLEVTLAAGRNQILREWNATRAEFDERALLHELVDAQARLTPDRPAIEFDGSIRTYQWLSRSADELAERLRTEGVGPGVIVGVATPRNHWLVVAMLGVLKAGGAYLPLDPVQPVARLTAMLRAAECELVLCDSEVAVDNLSQAGVRLLQVDRLLNEPNIAAPAPAVPHARAVTPYDPAYVIFTSGSTGQPKGVVVSHAAICNHMLWMRRDFPLQPEDRVLQRTPGTFDASVWEFYAPLMQGACLVLAPNDHVANIASFIADRQITVMQVVPSLLSLLLDEPAFRQASSVRQLFCGGEELPPGLRDRFMSCSAAQLINLYGPTEAAIDSTFWVCRKGDQGPVPIGRPIANATAYVLDGALNMQPIGVPGELYIGGRGLAIGYLADQQLTAARFIPDPFTSASHARLYRTGDQARWRPDGVLEYLGRVDHQVKVRGYRIEPGEIDATMRQHSQVSQSITIVREDVAGDRRLVTYIERREHASPNEAADADDSHVGRLRSMYEEIYDQAPLHADPLLNTIGWNSSYDAKPIPLPEMVDWIESTVARLRRLKPRRIVELGCGVGLILLRLAEDAEQYIGTDFSRLALSTLANAVAQRPHLKERVQLYQQSVDRLDGLQVGEHDLVVLNSVCQYFPSPHYLYRVIRGAANLLRPGGFIFLGDLRSLPLLDAFHLSLELQRDEGAPVHELGERLQRRRNLEKELVIDPALFAGLYHELPDLRAVWVEPKDSPYLNELTRFRYDVTLQFGGSAPATMHVGQALDWERQRLTVSDIVARLKHQRPDVMQVTRVPNSRVAGLATAIENLHSAQDIAEIKRLASAEQPPWLSLLVKAADEVGYLVQSRWLSSSRAGEMDLFFLNRERNSQSPQSQSSPGHGSWPRPQTRIGESRLLREFTNHPRESADSRVLGPELRAFAADRLPDYMVPTAVVVLEKLPLGRHGKVDRASLPPVHTSWVSTASECVAPRDALEEVLAALWAEVLRVQRVGVLDHFFSDLGGHSLLATQLSVRVRETFRCDMPLRTIFENPTVATLAAALRHQANGEQLDSIAETLLEIMRLGDEDVSSMLATQAIDSKGAL